MVVLIVIGSIILLKIICGIGPTSPEQSSTAAYNNEPVTNQAYTQTNSNTSTEKQWVQVMEFKGSGSKKSANFHLLGNEQKLVYTYHSNNPYNGIFAVYVVDKGVDIMKTGGFPEMTIDKLKDNSESTIQKETGDYYLNVTAVGNWTIKVMEIQ